MRSYSEMLKLESHTERLAYLQLLDNNVDSPRHMSQSFYKSKLWLATREAIIERDMGFDLGVFGVYIDGAMIVHHINPINEHDIRNLTDKVFDPENLITTSTDTHNKIHYKVKPKDSWVERKPGDTIFW